MNRRIAKKIINNISSSSRRWQEAHARIIYHPSSPYKVSLKLSREEDLDKFFLGWFSFYEVMKKIYKSQDYSERKLFLTGRGPFVSDEKFELPDLESDIEIIKDRIFYCSDRWCEERLEQVNKAVVKLRSHRG